MERPPVILLLDDDPDFVEINSRALRGGGYEVLCCHNVAEAHEALRAHRVDLVLTDLVMDSLDAGLAFARQMKADARWKRIPIVIATSITPQRGLDIHPRSNEDLAAMSVDAYLDKPVAPAALLKTIADLLKPRPEN